MPGVSIDNETVLEPNMVLAIEPFFWHEGKYPLWEVSNKYGCEDLVLVTESGYEILTPESIISRDIWVA
jgi:Xaa-Pro aminopeptidase